MKNDRLGTFQELESLFKIWNLDSSSNSMKPSPRFSSFKCTLSTLNLSVANFDFYDKRIRDGVI